MYLEIKNIYKTIGGVTILRHINLEMERGKIYGLRGKNGSGKTMLMRTISGLVLPTRGKIIIDGETLGKDISFPRSLGALIENPGFVADYSGMKNLEVLASIQDRIKKKDIAACMEELGLDPNDKKKFKKYSLGMKQKLGIAAAVMEKPDMIILDEPLNALDEKTVNTVKEILLRHKARGALIIISCHDREELEFLSDEIFCIDAGKITGSYLVGETQPEETRTA